MKLPSRAEREAERIFYTFQALFRELICSLLGFTLICFANIYFTKIDFSEFLFSSIFIDFLKSNLSGPQLQANGYKLPVVKNARK